MGEIYCSVELLLARHLAHAGRYGLHPACVAVVWGSRAGLAVWWPLPRSGLRTSERSIADSLRRSDELAERNRAVVQRIRTLRVQASQISEAVLNRIVGTARRRSSSVHRGALSQPLMHTEAEVPLAAKASELQDAALSDLRSIIHRAWSFRRVEGLDLTSTLRWRCRTSARNAGRMSRWTCRDGCGTFGGYADCHLPHRVGSPLHTARKHAEARVLPSPDGSRTDG